jgi:hypothetical protein
LVALARKNHGKAEATSSLRARKLSKSSGIFRRRVPLPEPASLTNL